jgi:hypothetical protein
MEGRLKVGGKNLASTLHFAVAAPYCETGPQLLVVDFGGLDAVK